MSQIFRNQNKRRNPDKIYLSKEFFEGADIEIKVKAKVIYESDTDDIIEIIYQKRKAWRRQENRRKNDKQW